MADSFFSDGDRQLIVALTNRLTGASPETQPKLESSLVNIRRRMEVTQCKSLHEYLSIVEDSAEELAHFISAVTIHTTSWFREKPHFERLLQMANAAASEFQEGKRTQPFRVLSAGCSTGEEAYSMALVLEEVRLQGRGLDYVIEGWDVDPISVSRAKQAIYNANGLKEFPASARKFLCVGTGRTQGLFTFDKSLRDRCHFFRRSLLTSEGNKSADFDVIFCRNVLIYFNLETVKEIIERLVSRLKAEGHLCLGHSESIEASRYSLTALGNATYRKVTPIVQSKEKESPKRAPVKTGETPRPELILIGASTGGTEVLIKLIQNLPQPCPPVMVVQHIALSFAKPFAERLAQSSGLTLARPEAGQAIVPNHLYMALGDYHIGLKYRGGVCYLTTSNNPPIHSVRPAVDFLFHSAAEAAKRLKVSAVILTGMGKDGGTGLAALRQSGATTYVQDEASSTVFGMPKEAIALGAADYIGNPDFIRERLLTSLRVRLTKAS